MEGVDQRVLNWFERMEWMNKGRFAHIICREKEEWGVRTRRLFTKGIKKLI